MSFLQVKPLGISLKALSLFYNEKKTTQGNS